MPAPIKHTVEAIAAALEKTHGAIALAAKDLGASYNTVSGRVAKSPHLQEIVLRYRERRVDLAELKLEQAINEGQPWAIALTLRTQGKNRGYTERAEVTGPEGGAIQVKFVEVVKPNVADDTDTADE